MNTYYFSRKLIKYWFLIFFWVINLNFIVLILPKYNIDNIDIKNLIFFNSILVKWCNESNLKVIKNTISFFYLSIYFLKYIL